MKKIIGLSFIATLFIVLSSFVYLHKKAAPQNETEKYPTIAIGAKIPSGKGLMMGIDGKETDLIGQAKANGLLVIFSSNTCPFVVKWEDRYPMLKKMCDRFNIGMVMINSNELKRDGEDSYENMKLHAKEKNYTWPYLMDNASVLANAFGAKTTPHVFLFDKYYKLVYKGAIDDNYESAMEVKQQYAIDAITSLASGTKVEPAETKPVGCSVKRKI
jgi:thioredoxin-related protein